MTTKTIGRPSKLTPELQEKFCEIISKGNYITVACAALGIADSTYELWNKRAQEGDVSYMGFMSAVKKAQSDAEQELLGIIKDAANVRNWQAGAWILERTRPDRYSRRDRMEIHAKIGPAVEIEMLDQPVQIRTVDNNTT